jgi:hypothetical protein
MTPTKTLHYTSGVFISLKAAASPLEERCYQIERVVIPSQLTSGVLGLYEFWGL